VENQYRRVVPDAGNALAQQAIAEVFCVKATANGAVWALPNPRRAPDASLSALRCRSAFPPAPSRCATIRAPAGEVLTGKCKPHQCPLFGNTCNPQTAFGALMVLRRRMRRLVSISQQECEA
jgi:hydrogenase expression/formation protein HypD